MIHTTQLPRHQLEVVVKDRGVSHASKRKGTVYVFCKGAHPTHACETVTDHEKRLEIVKRDNLCFNCLAHHKVLHCQSSFDVKNARESTILPCATVNQHQQNLHG